MSTTTIAGATTSRPKAACAPETTECRVSLLEIEAWLRRLAYQMEHGRGQVVGPGTNARLARVATMADCIARRFAEPIQVADVAREASVNKQYAMVLFRETVGMTIGEYLTERRIAESRRLLLTTDLAVNQVGFAAGFGSESQFYVAFRRATGESPAAYRKRHAGLSETTSCPDPRRPPLAPSSPRARRRSV